MRRARKGGYTDETPIVTSEDSVPAGFVRLANMVASSAPRYTTLMKVLSDAHKKGHLPAVKLVRRISEMKTGPVFVDRHRADEIVKAKLREWESASVADSRQPVQPENSPAVEIGRGKTVVPDDSVLSLVERIDRLERLVTVAIKRVESTTDSVANVLSAVSDIQAAIELRLEVGMAGSMVGSDAGQDG